MEQWNDGIVVSLKDIFHFKFDRSTFGGPLIHPCKIPILIIPAFQHSNWGEAPNLIFGFPKNKKPQAFIGRSFSKSNNSKAAGSGNGPRLLCHII